MSRQYVTDEMLDKLSKANQETKGTTDYMKYHMCMESKFYRNGRWTNWKYMIWSIPVKLVNHSYYFKQLGDKLYIMRDVPCDETKALHTLGECIEKEVERFEVTDEVKKLWGLSDTKDEVELRRYGFELYCGRTYCGNGEKDTIDDCVKVLIDDGFCDKVKIHDNVTGMNFTVKIEGR